MRVSCTRAGTAAEAIGYLRATSEDTITHIEGQAGIHLIGDLVVGLLGASITAFIYKFSRPTLAWNVVWLFFPAVASLVWLVDFGHAIRFVGRLRRRWDRNSREKRRQVVAVE